MYVCVCVCVCVYIYIYIYIVDVCMYICMHALPAIFAGQFKRNQLYMYGVGRQADEPLDTFTYTYIQTRMHQEAS